jgi:hypothetical protein
LDVAKTRFVGMPSELVFATSNQLYFQLGNTEQLVSFTCEGQDFDARIIAVNMHIRNWWVERYSKDHAPTSDEQGAR